MPAPQVSAIDASAGSSSSVAVPRVASAAAIDPRAPRAVIARLARTSAPRVVSHTPSASVRGLPRGASMTQRDHTRQQCASGRARLTRARPVRDRDDLADTALAAPDATPRERRVHRGARHLDRPWARAARLARGGRRGRASGRRRRSFEPGWPGRRMGAGGRRRLARRDPPEPRARRMPRDRRVRLRRCRVVGRRSHRRGGGARRAAEAIVAGAEHWTARGRLVGGDPRAPWPQSLGHRVDDRVPARVALGGHRRDHGHPLRIEPSGPSARGDSSSASSSAPVRCARSSGRWSSRWRWWVSWSARGPTRSPASRSLWAERCSPLRPCTPTPCRSAGQRGAPWCSRSSAAGWRFWAPRSPRAATPTRRGSSRLLTGAAALAIGSAVDALEAPVRPAGGAWLDAVGAGGGRGRARGPARGHPGDPSRPASARGRRRAIARALDVRADPGHDHRRRGLSAPARRRPARGSPARGGRRAGGDAPRRGARCARGAAPRHPTARPMDGRPRSHGRDGDCMRRRDRGHPRAASRAARRAGDARRGARVQARRRSAGHRVSRARDAGADARARARRDGARGGGRGASREAPSRARPRRRARRARDRAARPPGDRGRLLGDVARWRSRRSSGARRSGAPIVVVAPSGADPVPYLARAHLAGVRAQGADRPGRRDERPRARPGPVDRSDRVAARAGRPRDARAPRRRRAAGRRPAARRARVRREARALGAARPARRAARAHDGLAARGSRRAGAARSCARASPRRCARGADRAAAPARSPRGPARHPDRSPRARGAARARAARRASSTRRTRGSSTTRSPARTWNCRRSPSAWSLDARAMSCAPADVDALGLMADRPPPSRRRKDPLSA